MRLGRFLFREDFEALGFDDLAGLDAAGAHANALAGSLNDSLHRLQVHVPTPTGGVVGVGDVVAELRAFAAEITFLRHVLLQS
jgi:hypothetical protein